MTTTNTGNEYPLDTDTFGNKNQAKPATVRQHYSRFGHYYGIVPKKLASGRLAWPDVQVADADVREAA